MDAVGVNGYRIGENLHCGWVWDVQYPRSVRMKWLRECWERMEEDGLTKWAMYTDPGKCFTDFAVAISNPGVELSFVFVGENGEQELAGFFWLTDGCFSGAPYGHFCLFRKYHADAVQILGRILASLFKTFDVIRARLPEINRAAIKVAQDLGFKTIGAVPRSAWIAWLNRPVGMVEMYLAKEDFQHE